MSARDTRDGSGPSVAVIGLFVLAVIYTLYFAADLLSLIAVAILISLLLSPSVKWLARLHVPPALSAATLLAVLVGVLVTIVMMLTAPAEQWLQDAAVTLRDLRYEIVREQQNMGGIKEFAEEVDNLAAVDDSEESAQAVVVKRSKGTLETIVGSLPRVAVGTAVVVFLTFFLLATGESNLRRLTRWGRTWGERRRIVTIARRIQTEVSRYLVTITIINVCLGIIVGLCMSLLGVPNPALWGVMATVFNFAPYAGPIALLFILTVVGVSAFDTLPEALRVPLAYLALTAVEGQLVTPTIVGRQLSMSPLVVFLSIIVWGWLWGVVGALIAVPIVNVLIVVCDHIPRLEAVSALLRGGAAGRDRAVTCQDAGPRAEPAGSRPPTPPPLRPPRRPGARVARRPRGRDTP